MRVLALPRQLPVLGVVPRDRELLRERRDRAALQKVKLAIAQRALDVDRPAHDRLELDRKARDRGDVGAGDRRAVCAGPRCDREVPFPHGVAVGSDRAGGDRVAETARGVHDDDVARAAHGLRAERDGGSVGRDHELHEHRDARCARHAALLAVRRGAIRRHRPPALEQGVDDGVDAADVEDRFVLAGE